MLTYLKMPSTRRGVSHTLFRGLRAFFKYVCYNIIIYKYMCASKLILSYLSYPSLGQGLFMGRHRVPDIRFEAVLAAVSVCRSPTRICVSLQSSFSAEEMAKVPIRCC